MGEKTERELKALKSSISELVNTLGAMQGLSPKQIAALRRKHGSSAASRAELDETPAREAARLALAARMGLSPTNLTGVQASDCKLVLGADTRIANRASNTNPPLSPAKQFSAGDHDAAAPRRRIGVGKHSQPTVVSTSNKLMLGVID